MNTFTELTIDIFNQKILNENTTAVLIFGNDWSGNYEIMKQVIQRISNEFYPKVHFYHADVVHKSEMAKFFGIKNIPTTILVSQGEIIEKIEGFISAKKIRQKLASFN